MAKKTEGKVKKERFKTLKQVAEVIKMTNELDPSFKSIAAVATIIPIIVFIVLAVITGLYAIFVPFAVLGGVIGFMVVLNKKAQSAGFGRIEGEPGASGAVLSQTKLPSISFEEQPVAVDQKTRDLIFRGVGRAGIVFVTEGPTSRVKKLVDKEIQRTKRILPNVPIHVVNSGNEPGQVPLKGLRKAVSKPKFVLKNAEVVQIRSRLTALGGMKMPIPKGMDPNRMPKGVNRRALRGK